MASFDEGHSQRDKSGIFVLGLFNASDFCRDGEWRNSEENTNEPFLVHAARSGVMDDGFPGHEPRPASVPGSRGFRAVLPAPQTPAKDAVGTQCILK